jgi:hypothetical protein
MQQHIHSTIASFGRTKGTRRREERERERGGGEEEKRVQGRTGKLMGGRWMESSNLGKMSSDYIDVNDINNCLHETRWRRTDGKLIPGKKCHPI